MLIYKQRYKPRTTREFTKSDLTVYDSADNTALNALTVYGKSEVVNGAIKSAGEGYAVVDLGTLNWVYESATQLQAFRTNSLDTSIKKNISDSAITNYILCETYKNSSVNATIAGRNNMQIAVSPTGWIWISNFAYTDATAFKTAMSGVLLCYQLADPSQGNAIAVKTDNGTGVNGTMAVFSTGTPLRGIPETTVRDVMVWDGSSGEVTKNCGEVDLGTLSWRYETSYAHPFFYAGVPNIKINSNGLIPIFQKIDNTWLGNFGNTAENNQFCFNSTQTNTPVFIRCDAYSDIPSFQTAMNGVKLIYELATPTTQPLTSTENASIAELRTFTPQTHAQNNAQTDMTVDYTIRVPTI